MARQRKQLPLRIPHELYEAYQEWAAHELRSVNAQIEAVLTDAARRAGRLRGRRGSPPDAPEAPPAGGDGSLGSERSPGGDRAPGERPPEPPQQP